MKKLSIEELAKLISPSSEAVQELKRRGVLRTKNTVGELGEHYAIELYNKIDYLIKNKKSFYFLDDL